MTNPNKTDRHAKGVNIVDLVRRIKTFRRQHPSVKLSPAAEAVLLEYITPTKWYPLEVFHELVDFMYKKNLGSSADKAIEVGMAGGRAALEGFHKVYITKGDPAASVNAMRHGWRTYFDFGELEVKLEGDHTAYFTLKDYPDIPQVHGLLVIGWDMAAAQVAGAKKVTYEILESPWRGGSCLRYRIDFQ
jgi:hypothetical protein